MSPHCKVIFPRNPLNVFYIDRTVRGYVQLDQQEQPILSIRIEIIGNAFTKLKHNNVTRVYRENFFKHKISVLGNSMIGPLNLTHFII